MKVARIETSEMAEVENAISSVVYFQGCDLDCPYCHNPSLIPKKVDGMEDVDAEWVLSRIGLKYVDWLVLSGGEPLVQKDISGMVELVKKVREVGKKVELQTNGDFSTHDPNKNIRLIALSRYIDKVVVGVKRIQVGYLDHLIGMLKVSNLLRKTEFRLVVYEGSFPVVDDGVMEMIGECIPSITLTRNSMHGRGENMPPASDDYIREVGNHFKGHGTIVHYQ